MKNVCVWGGGGGGKTTKSCRRQFTHCVTPPPVTNEQFLVRWSLYILSSEIQLSCLTHEVCYKKDGPYVSYYRELY